MIMSQDLVSRKYAVAYLNMFQDKITSENLENLKKVIVFFKKNPAFFFVVCATETGNDEASLFIDRLFKGFDISESMKKLLRLLIEHKRMSYLRTILQDIYCLYKFRKNVLELKIYTAEELDQQSYKKLEKFVAEQSGATIISSVEIDKKLLAGVRLESDFYLWDHSIANKLRLLRQKLIVKG